MPRPRAVLLVGLTVLALLLAVPLYFANGSDRGAVTKQRIGLFTSLPLLWPEAADIGGLLRDRSPPHWSLAVLRQPGELVPLDTLAPEGHRQPLAGIGLLVMAQPRALSPAENVALDQWVRDGGHVLLFADPMLTAGSAYALGDPRRPQDMVMISPILARWGLRLEFDEDQPPGERMAAMFGQQAPVSLAGRFALAGQARACQIRDGGLIALCGPGKGTVLGVADAELLAQPDGESAAVRGNVLKRLMEVASE